MRIVLLLLFLCLMLSPPLLAQRLSPLFNIPGANSLIDKDPEFRKMQDAIADALKNQPAGLRIGAVYEKFKEFRTAVIGRIRAIKLVVDDTAGKEAISIVFPKLANLTGPVETESKELFAVTTPGVTITWKNLKEAIRTEIKSRTTELLNKAVSSKSFSDVANADVQNWFFASLRTAMNGVGLVPDRDPEGATEAEKFADMFASIVVERFSSRLAEALSDQAGLSLADGMTISNALISTKTRFKQYCEEQFSSRVEVVAQAAIDQFDKLESTIASASEKLNKALVAGHAGLAVSDSGGDTQAGITFTWRPSDLFQAGVFTNLQLDAPTKKQTGPLMLGVQFRFTASKGQLDLMGGITFRDSANAGVANSYEGGAGISYNTGSAIIAGVVTALERHPLGTNATQMWISAGLQIRLPGAGLPAFTFAWNWNDGLLQNNGLPIVQVAFPIQSNP
ncbi:MAG: hypothetical protein JST22_20670 [Bacteroidetes bacterium]|nr:hypothetical protein [Bacteroidota bacterium]